MFQHGVASSDPLSDGAILWTGVTLVSAKPLLPVTWVWATDPGLGGVVLRGATATGAARDITVKIDAAGRRPGTTWCGAGQDGGLRTPEPAHAVVRLADDRMRHAEDMRDADSQSVHRPHLFVCLWDDHEITNDTCKTGAQQHQGATEGAFADRLVGLQAHQAWMPIRQVQADLRTTFRRFQMGSLVDLPMLEERLGARSQQLDGGSGVGQTGAFSDAGRMLPGPEQEAWLFHRLQTSEAPQWDGHVQTFATAFEVQAGTSLVPSAQTTPRAGAPLPAP